jgi:O-antigen ligase
VLGDRHLAPSLLLLAAVAEAVLWEGGFAPAPRYVFGGLALAAVATSAIADRRTAARAARQPLVIVLGVLGALGAVSAAWTVGIPGDALRWGLVTAGYGAIAVTACVLATRRWGVTGIATGVCALALGGGVVGLVGATVIGEPIADRIGGAWRPGGPLEYSAALALLEVSALPALLAAMCSGRRWLAAAGAGGAAVAGAVLGLSGSRAELALAVLVGCVAIAIPEQTLRATRSRATAAAIFVAATGATSQLIAGGYFPPGSLPGAWRLVGLLAVCLLAAAAWALTPRIGLVPGWRTGVPVAVAVAAALTIGLSAGAGTSAGRPARPARAVSGVERSGGFLHGRQHLWHAALVVFSKHPLAGTGADSFFLASARYQAPGPIRFAHDMPLELAAELGVPGLLLTLALYGAIGWALWAARARRGAWLLAPGAFAFMAANLIDWPWHLAGSGAVWAACAGGVVGIALVRERVHAPQPRRPAS